MGGGGGELARRSRETNPLTLDDARLHRRPACSALFEHVFESYQGEGAIIYVSAA